MSQSIAASTSYAKNEEMINRIILAILQQYPNINTYYLDLLVGAVTTAVEVYSDCVNSSSREERSSAATECVELGENIDEDSIINFVSECIYDIFPYDHHWKHEYDEVVYDEDEYDEE